MTGIAGASGGSQSGSDARLPGRLDTVLHEWQRRAVRAWSAGDRDGPNRGTLEVFTGGGKTLIGLACFEQVRSNQPDLRLAVVVPTVALARQWLSQLVDSLGFATGDVGLMGAGGDASLARYRAVISVLNSAAEKLPDHGFPAEQVMLIVDECHRAGADTFQKVLDTPAAYRLGLSATPQRDDTDEHGQPLDYDSSVLGRKLGRIVYRFGLREARLIGWLPTYEVHHHALTLEDDERAEYDRLSRRVDDAADALREGGHPTSAARNLASRGGDVGEAARQYVSSTSARKDLLYRARQRHRVASLLTRSELAGTEGRRILLFHERIKETAELHAALITDLESSTNVELEHSELSESRREQALARFGRGDAQVLVSVRSLIEGIDVPAADVGVSVASSSSVRQRVQALGRVLRRSFDDPVGKQAAMHVLYVGDTVDDFIYAREDWSDLTGAEVNHYWSWPVSGGPERQDGPPRTPKPTEEQIWEALGGELPAEPVGWEGVLPEFEYSVDTRANVRTATGAVVANPQGVGSMVEAIRGRPGGRFRVTPTLRLVIVTDETGSPWLAGQLAEPFEVGASDEPAMDLKRGRFTAGDELPGRPDASRGTFQVRQKTGGLIERRRGRDREFAIRGEHNGPPGAAADTILNAWRRAGLPGLPVSISSEGIVWFESGGAPRFLAEVASDLVFPSDGET